MPACRAAIITTQVPELHRHGWQVLDGAQPILLDTPPEQRWTACWRSLGIDPALLAGETGRA